MIGNTEIILITLVILLIFGAAAIPKIFRAMGKAKGEFQKGLKETEKEMTEKEKTDDVKDD